MNKVIQIEIPEYNDRKSAAAAIAKLLERSEEIERAAEIIADEHCVTFDVGEYGNGRTYYPAGHDAHWLVEYHDLEVDENNKLIEGVWLSSSDMC
ncbi:hypothetical protein PSH1140_115 [Enterobacter phage myPSH1140]|uniref:Uncharacterized protein n=1 Tax=Enterobacter phage myPSH1140 TaxID=2108137 RepID=A0A2R3ZX58_9CAUD|nr:hypothetical protein KNT83_gp115 [Enterobacter phage myPSH1140]AVR55320.1 hypothetical protein PSH1140_115 [Enterobacter phage myPSH1140]